MTQGDDGNRPARPAIPPFAPPGAAPRAPLRPQLPQVDGGGGSWTPFVPPAAPGPGTSPIPRPPTPVAPFTPAGPAPAARPATPAGPATPARPAAPARAATPTPSTAAPRPFTPPPALPPAPLASPTAAAAHEPLDVDLDELLEDEPASGASASIPTPPELESLAAEVEETAAEYAPVRLDRPNEQSIAASEHVEAAVIVEGADTRDVPPAAVEALAATVEPREAHVPEDLGVEGDAVVSYSEPAITPALEREEHPTPLASMRVPAIPDLDLHVAAALESVAQRIRAGELKLPRLDIADDEASSIALALSALLAARR